MEPRQARAKMLSAVLALLALTAGAGGLLDLSRRRSVDRGCTRMVGLLLDLALARTGRPLDFTMEEPG